METKHQHRHEPNTMVIGLGHMVLVFVMLLGSLVLSMITLLGEYVTCRVLKYGAGRLNYQEYNMVTAIRDIWTKPGDT